MFDQNSYSMTLSVLWLKSLTLILWAIIIPQQVLGLQSVMFSFYSLTEKSKQHCLKLFILQLHKKEILVCFFQLLVYFEFIKSL